VILIRPAHVADTDQIVALAAEAGPGFTSLVVGRDALAERVEKSAQCFGANVAEPGDERYVLVAEDEDGKLCGMSGLKATVGIRQPFFNFKLLTLAQSSPSVDIRFDLEVLMMVNEYAGCTEVGSLFVAANARKSGAGRLLATTRYQFIASEPGRFADTILAELRGVTDDAGRSPFWEAVGAHFFHMSFEEADRLTTGPHAHFLLDLMPRFPVYLDLLPKAARDVVGVPHKDGAPALRLLEKEGFRYGRVVDVFDAGPLVSVRKTDLETVRRAKHRTLVDGPAGVTPCLLSTGTGAGFRALHSNASVGAEGEVAVGEDVRRRLGVTTGSTLLVREL
jgi:arginine N-succinyltransferase